MCRVSAGQSISQASLDCAVTLFVFILSNFFHFPVCNLNIFFVLVCVCEFIFVMLHKLYCAASTFPLPHPCATPSSCYCCSLARRIHCKLLFFTRICAHFYFHFIFGTCQWIVCHATSCARAGRGSQPTLLLPPHPNGVCLCNFCGKLRVVCPAAVLHPFNPFSSLSPHPLCCALVDLGDGCSVRHAACGRANLYNGSLNSFTYNAYHICIATWMCV